MVAKGCLKLAPTMEGCHGLAPTKGGSRRGVGGWLGWVVGVGVGLGCGGFWHQRRGVVRVVFGAKGEGSFGGGVVLKL
jgi:hypothetical protein